MPSKMAIAYQMKKKEKQCASGGMVESGDPTMNYADGGDIVGKALAKKMSKGGQVANDTGEGTEASKKPNQFDYLVLEDDLEHSYTGENSGDYIGGPKKDDLVSRAMLRKKAKR